MSNELPTIIISIITIIVSAYLSYYFSIQSNLKKEKDEKKKKLNKLLYHLLIVRKAESAKLNLKLNFEYINKFQTNFLKEKNFLTEQEISDIDINEIIETQFKLISKSLFEKLKTESENSKRSVEIIQNEYTEIDPLFSLFLKNYDNKIKTIFLDNILSMYSHEDGFELFQQFLVPHFEDKMIKEIDEVIHSITSKLDAKTQREVQEILIYYDNPELDKDEYEEYLEKVLIPIKNARENH